MPLPPPLHPSSVLRRPHRTPSLWGALGDTALITGGARKGGAHRGSPERWGSAPGGAGDASGSERASRHPSSIRPSTAHSHRPPATPPRTPGLGEAAAGSLPGSPQQRKKPVAARAGRGRVRWQRHRCGRGRGGQLPWAGQPGAGQRPMGRGYQTRRKPTAASAFALLPTPERAHTGLCNPANTSPCAHGRATRTPRLAAGAAGAAARVQPPARASASVSLSLARARARMPTHASRPGPPPWNLTSGAHRLRPPVPRASA